MELAAVWRGLLIQEIPQPAGTYGFGAVGIDPFAKATIGRHDCDGAYRVFGGRLSYDVDNGVIPGTICEHDPHLTKLRPIVHRSPRSPFEHNHDLNRFGHLLIERRQFLEQPTRSPRTIPPPPIRPRPHHVRRIHHNQPLPLTHHPPSLLLPHHPHVAQPNQPAQSDIRGPHIRDENATACRQGATTVAEPNRQDQRERT